MIRALTVKDLPISVLGVMAKRTAVFIWLITAVIVLISGERHFGEDKDVHDEGHIMQHFQGKVDIEKLSNEQKRFYYFHMSDQNKDRLIDGNEIIKALTHEHADYTGPSYGVKDEDRMIGTIDKVLMDMDKNGDGYIDFSEFMYDLEST